MSVVERFWGKAGRKGGTRNFVLLMREAGSGQNELYKWRGRELEEDDRQTGANQTDIKTKNLFWKRGWQMKP